MKTHQYTDTLTTPALSSTQPRSLRPHSPIFPDWHVIQPKINKTRRNIDIINYCEIDNIASESLHNLTLDSPAELVNKINTDQNTIGWDHFIRDHLSLSFSPIAASY